MSKLRNKYKAFGISNIDFFLWWLGGIALVGLVGWIVSIDGKSVAKVKHMITNHTRDSSFNIPSFRVQEGKIYRVKVRSGSLNNSWFGIGITLENNHDEPINELDVEFWHESGYDDGYWSEDDYKEILYFKATKTDTLSGEVYWVNSSQRKTMLQQNNIEVNISTAGTKLAANYFKYLCWICGGICLLLVGLIYGDS